MATNCILTTWNTNDCQIDAEAMLASGVSFTVPVGSVSTTPAHGGNFLLSVYDPAAPTIPVIQFGSGTFLDVSQGHFPAGTNTTFPLPPISGRKYFVVVKTADGISNCGCLDVPDWTLCDTSVQVDFEGFTEDPSFTYLLPTDVTQDRLDWIFNTDQVPDQMIIRQGGIVIVDTGFVTTLGGFEEGPAYQAGDPNYPGNFQDAPFVPGVDVEVEFVLDASQPDGTITIFSSSFGCCTDAEDCEIPHRDPMPLLINFTDCGFLAFVNPTLDNPAPGRFGNVFGSWGPVCWRTNIERILGAGCISTFSDVPDDSFISIGNIRRFVRVINGCQSSGVVPTTPSTTGSGIVTLSGGGFTGTVTVDTENPTKAAELEAFLQFLDAEHLDNVTNLGPADGVNFSGATWFLAQQNKVPACPGDGVNVNSQFWRWVDGMWSRSGNVFTIDFSSLPATIPCETDGGSIGFYNWIRSSGQTNQVFNFYGVTGFPNTDPDGFIRGTFDSGITTPPPGCVTHSPVQTYTYEVDPVNEEFFIRNANGDITFNYDEVRGMPNNFRQDVLERYYDRCPEEGNVLFFGVKNADGWQLQEVQSSTGDYVDWSKTYNLSYYGGMNNETFANGDELADRVSTLTGAPIIWVTPGYLFDSSLAGGDYEWITCN